MMDWARLPALAPLAGALVTAPVSAQDDHEWSDDHPLVVIDEHTPRTLSASGRFRFRAFQNLAGPWSY